MHSSPLRFLASILPGMVILTVLLTRIELYPKWSLALLAATAIAACVLLSHAWSLIKIVGTKFKPTDLAMIRAYVVAHIILLGFASSRLYCIERFGSSGLWFAAFALFFGTGRQTWEILNRTFPSPMYQFFVRGHTAMILMGTALGIIGTLLGISQMSSFAFRALCIYVVIHTSLLGMAIRKIDSDLRSSESQPRISP